MREPAQLGALQRRMLGRLTASVTSEPGDDPAEYIRGDASRDAAARLRVYEDMYYARLREALEAYFPKVAAALGDDFDAVARAYLSLHPSRQPSLRHIGASLPAFLDGPMCPIAVGRPWLGALARLELARLDVFDAVDEPLLTRAHLATLAAEAFATLPIRLVAARRTLRFEWAVDRLFAAATDVVAERCALLVGRRGIGVYHRRLGPLEAELLAALGAPLPFADVCERIAARVGEARGAEVGCALLARWIDDQLLAAALA